METVEKTTQLLNTGRNCVNESNQQVYKLSKELQWRFLDRFDPDKCFCLIGWLHIEKINPSSLWFTNRKKWCRQNYGIVWIIHCWDGLFCVSKQHQKGKGLYSSCSLCHVLTINISPQGKWRQKLCAEMVKKSKWRKWNVSLLEHHHKAAVKSFDFC